MNNTNKEIPTAEQVLEYRNKFTNCEIMSESEIIEAQKWCENFENRYDLMTKAYEENGKFGLKDAAGKVLIPAIYDSIGFTFHDDFMDRLVAVQLGDKAGLVTPDGKGTPFTQFEYDDISLVGAENNCYEEFYLMTIGDKCGLSDMYGHFYIPMGADEIIEPCFETIPYVKDGKYGFASTTIDVTTEAIYDDYEFQDEYLVVTKDGESGYIDIDGKFTTDPEKKHFNCINWEYKAWEESLEMEY